MRWSSVSRGICVKRMYYGCSLGRLFFKQKTAYEMRISDWSSDVCSSDLEEVEDGGDHAAAFGRRGERLGHVEVGRLVASGDDRERDRVAEGGLKFRGGDGLGVKLFQVGEAVDGRGVGVGHDGPPVSKNEKRPERLRRPAARGSVERCARRLGSEEHTSELQSLMRHSYAV